MGEAVAGQVGEADGDVAKPDRDLGEVLHRLLLVEHSREDGRGAKALLMNVDILGKRYALALLEDKSRLTGVPGHINLNNL